MKLTASILAKAAALKPGAVDRRLVFDPRGIHHKIIPSTSVTHSVSNHAKQKNLSVAESLYVARKLVTLGAARSQSTVSAHGAIFQAFHGNAGGNRACHTMPCQLVLDNQFPHVLRVGDKPLNGTFLQRTLTLFGRCTWQPPFVNTIDQALEWIPQDGRPFGFVSQYLDSVEAVIAGQDPRDAYWDFAKVKARKLTEVLEQTNDEPLTVHDAVLLAGTEGSGLSPQELQQLQIEKADVNALQEQRAAVVQTLLDQDRIIPHAVLSGELQHAVDGELWR